MNEISLSELRSGDKELPELYKHKSGKDVAFEPLNFVAGDSQYNLLVQWWNIASKSKVFTIGTPEPITIKKSDFANWSRLKVENL